MLINWWDIFTFNHFTWAYVFIRVNDRSWVRLYFCSWVFLINVWCWNSLLTIVHSVFVHLDISIVRHRLRLINYLPIRYDNFLFYFGLSHAVVIAVNIVRICVLRSHLMPSWRLSSRLLMWRFVLISLDFFFLFLLFQVSLIVMVLIDWLFYFLNKSWAWNCMNEKFLVGDSFTALFALFGSWFAVSQMRRILSKGDIQVAVLTILGSIVAVFLMSRDFIGLELLFAVPARA